MNHDFETPSVTVGLEDTIILATYAHRGQFDKAGEPYICHPLRLMLTMSTLEERTVALLHDTVEDSPVTLNDLREAGYSSAVVEAIERLTHAEGVDYFDYVAKIKSNSLATKVKMADLRDNMNLSRIAKPTMKDESRVEKYQKAMAMLEAK